MELWPITLDARRSLLTTFEQLDGDQWDTPSLCGEWTVREVLAHLILAMKPPLRRYAATAARMRGSFDRANHHLAVEDAKKPLEELLADYRSALEHRFAPPGWPEAAPLSDILLHSLDVRVSLGIDDDTPPAHYEPVMGLILGLAGRAVLGSRPPAVRWVATDLDWRHGDGDEVRGAMADLALAAAGRRARIDHLDGYGVEVLWAWLGRSEPDAS